MTFTADSQKMLGLPNAGGSSVISEMMSCEMMVRAFGTKLMKTEMEVSYFPEGGSLTDYTCKFRDLTIGVSVTRAMKYWGGDFTMEDATKLLNKKLTGVVQSTKNSLEKWDKQVLHVWSMNKHVANVLIQAYDLIPQETKSNTVVLVTIAENSSEIFHNR